MIADSHTYLCWVKLGWLGLGCQAVCSYGDITKHAKILRIDVVEGWMIGW